MQNSELEFNWTPDEFFLAISALRRVLNHPKGLDREQFDANARAEVRQLIVSKRVNAANLLRLMTGTVNPPRPNRSSRSG